MATANHDLDKTSEILEFCMKETPPKFCERFITRLKARCKLTVYAGNITLSSLAGMATDIKKFLKDSRAARTVLILSRFKNKTPF